MLSSRIYHERSWQWFDEPPSLCAAVAGALTVVADALYLGRSSFALINPRHAHVRAKLARNRQLVIETFGIDLHHIVVNQSDGCVSSPTLSNDVLRAVVDGGVERVVPALVAAPNFATDATNVAHHQLEGVVHTLSALHAARLARTHGGVGHPVGAVSSVPDPLKHIGWTGASSRQGMSHVIRDADGVVASGSSTRAVYQRVGGSDRGIEGRAVRLPRHSGTALYGRPTTLDIPVGDMDVMPGTVVAPIHYAYPNTRNMHDMTVSLSSYFDTACPFGDVDPFTGSASNGSRRGAVPRGQATVLAARWPACGPQCVWRPPPLTVRDGHPLIPSPSLGFQGPFHYRRPPPFDPACDAIPTVGDEPAAMAAVVDAGRPIATKAGDYTRPDPGSPPLRVCAYNGPPLTADVSRGSAGVSNPAHLPTAAPTRRAGDHCATRPAADTVRGLDSSGARVAPWYVDGCRGGGASSTAAPPVGGDAVPPSPPASSPQLSSGIPRRRTLLPYDVDDLLPLTLVRHLVVSGPAEFTHRNNDGRYMCDMSSVTLAEADTYPALFQRPRDPPASTPGQPVHSEHVRQHHDTTFAGEGARTFGDRLAQRALDQERLEAAEQEQLESSLEHEAAQQRLRWEGGNAPSQGHGGGLGGRGTVPTDAESDDGMWGDARRRDAEVSSSPAGQDPNAQDSPQSAQRPGATSAVTNDPPHATPLHSPASVLVRDASTADGGVYYRPAYLPGDVESVSLLGALGAVAQYSFPRIPPAALPVPFLLFPSGYRHHYKPGGGSPDGLWFVRQPRSCARAATDDNARWMVVSRYRPAGAPVCWARRGFTEENSLREAVERASGNGILPPVRWGDFGLLPLRDIADLVNDHDVIANALGAFDTHLMYAPRGALRIVPYTPNDYMQHMGTTRLPHYLASRRLMAVLMILPSCHSESHQCNISIPSNMFISALAAVRSGDVASWKGGRVAVQRIDDDSMAACAASSNASQLRTFVALHATAIRRGSLFGFDGWEPREYPSNSLMPQPSSLLSDNHIPAESCERYHAALQTEGPVLWPRGGHYQLIPVNSTTPNMLLN